MNVNNAIKGYDVIGDIHGHADKLIQLLKKLGYQNDQSNPDCYSHPDRIVIFLGDFIDRGKQNIKVLQIVRSMVDSGSAKAVMGNHEYNALCYHSHLLGVKELLRSHSDKNKKQHQSFLDEFSQSPDLLLETLHWFLKLPLLLELNGLRFVHACWDEKEITYLKNTLPEHKLTTELLITSVNKNSRLHQSVMIVLKGQELTLPKGASFYDKDNHERKEVRVAWWQDFGKTYRDIAVVPDEDKHRIPDIALPVGFTFKYPADKPAVFFGHYWRTGEPVVLNQAKNAFCLDYSVAKGGKLCSYRCNNDEENDSNFVCV